MIERLFGRVIKIRDQEFKQESRDPIQDGALLQNGVCEYITQIQSSTLGHLHWVASL